MKTDVTAVLNTYKRPQNFADQLQAVEFQSISPQEILVWHNGGDLGGSRAKSRVCPIVHSYNLTNMGVWARFAYALNAKTEFVCVFDDDTIPGPRWFENCLAEMERREALLGTIGLLYVDPPAADDANCSYWAGATKIGWGCNNETAIEVDFVGHAWFFRRAWLSTFWRELPPPQTTLCGEDMHFSFMLQKYLGVPTVVPPHPTGDPSLWGSTRGHLGRDEVSLWESNPGGKFREDMDDFFKAQRRRGWRLINDAR